MKKILRLFFFCSVFTSQAQFRLVKDISTDNGGSSPEALQVVNNRLFFTAKTANERAVYTSDGTTSGTLNLRFDDFVPGENGDFIYNIDFGTSFYKYNDETIFSGVNPTNLKGYVLKVPLNGNEATIVNDISTNISQQNGVLVEQGIVYNDSFIFRPNDSNATESIEPYIINLLDNNLSTNLSLLRDIYPANNNSSNFLFPTAFNGEVFFTANDGVNGLELWKTDGTTSGTSLFMDVNIGSGDGYPDQFNILGAQLTFVATEGSWGRELLKTSGNTGSLVLVKDINPSTGSSNPTNVVRIDQELYFSANDGINGFELWKSNGNSSGTVMLKDINPSGNSDPKNFTKVGSEVFFTANDGVNCFELWKTDGTSSGTVLVKDIFAGVDCSNPNNFVEYNGKLYFVAASDVSIYFYQLWVSDGTPTGTFMIPLNASSQVQPRDLVVFNNELYFTADDGSGIGRELWAYKDPTLVESDFDLKEDTISIYPNPSNDVFQIQSDLAIEKIELYSLQGQLVKSFQTQNQYNVADVAKGMYLVKINTQEGIVNKTLIIE